MHIFPVHISSLISHVATATLFLREIICPRKSDANLKQVIIFIRKVIICEPPFEAVQLNIQYL